MSEIENKGLGRIWTYDPRAAEFPLRAFMDERIHEAPASRLWKRGPILDQGSEGACVGFAWSAWYNAEPSLHSLQNQDALGVYNRAKQIDEWAGEDYSGTSVQAGAKVMRERKFLDTFAWASNPTDMSLWVRTYGPLTWACKWRRDMYRTDANGFLRFGGDVVGGHALCCIGVDEQGNFIVQNSWGTDFGNGGICKVTPAVMNQIFSDGQWSACTAVEIGAAPEPIKPTPPDPTPDPVKPTPPQPEPAYRPGVHRQGLNSFNTKRGALLDEEHVLFIGGPDAASIREIGRYIPKAKDK